MSEHVLAGGTVVTSLRPPRLVAADLSVTDGRVEGVGEVDRAGASVRDCTGCLVIPGNVCAHHHLYSSLARGMPYGLEPPHDFLQILQRVWWRLDRALDEETIWASAVVGGAVSVLSGTTTIVDHHASPNSVEGSLDVVASALSELGVRSVLCYEVSDRDGPQAAESGLEENRRFLKGSGPLARGMVGAHASFTLSEESLSACVDLARSEGVGIHIHAAEDPVDQADARARFGTGVVARLAAAGALDESALLAHGVHLDDAELEAVSASGATVVHNPRSNMHNGVGHARVGRFPLLALGTDGLGGDLFAESHAGYWRAREDDLSLAPSWTLDRLADSARVAAGAFGEPLLGSLQPGAPADLVVLAYDPPTPLREQNLAGHWAFGLTARHVRDVMVAGRWAVLDRRLAGVDSVEVTERCRRAAGRLWSRLQDVEPHAFRPAGTR